MFLDKVKVGGTGTVKTLKATPVIRKRLLAMGLTPGIDFKVVKVAPMGDPIEIKVRGYQLTMRKNEASCVEIEEVEV
ncbi:MAG TPA: ferrous iron transport protein A [Thermotogota bacterium]|nr:ferrous iron transport protein A [Thermotogota bacterium]HPJ88548.1 ferrous iron transport protein A [Thermotogota bacterium]HPR96482.1 ferrous iron transport protein A [Thermotogota bacterium]